jgi:transcription elongation factor GreA
MAEDNTISAEGRAKAEAELEHRRTVRRAEIVAAIKVAREFGDLKENAEYHAAREDQGHNEARIRVLEHHLATSTVAEPAENDGTIGVGSKVRYRDAASADDTEVTLVHPLETDIGAGKISVDSPIGKALLGAGPGDEVALETRRGEKRLEILAVD